MKGIGFNLFVIIALVIIGGLGLFGLQPGLTLVALCALPIATMMLGWSIGRAGLRVSVSSRDGF
jgi:hypothetical protein